MGQGPPLFVKWRQVGGLIGLPVKAVAVKGAVVNYLLIFIDTFEVN